ncbi:MAG: stage IV sporulation protein A, partial [Firmicutes bacterium]|nr:stage IV sporulation protein A [Bacillota bacterium]
DDAVEIVVAENLKMKVRMVDCVGYTVEGALGYDDGGKTRMVTTPWFDYDIPFEEAAEIGTRKVIGEHSTVGIVVTTDGSITEIPRENYLEAEKRIISELKEINKPFVVLLNSAHPQSQETKNLKQQLEEEYRVPVIIVDCLALNEKDIDIILKEALYEFPVQEVHIKLPSWLDALGDSHPIIEEFQEIIRSCMESVLKVRDFHSLAEKMTAHEKISNTILKDIELGSGKATIIVETPRALFEEVLSDIAGVAITSEADIVKVIKDYSVAKKAYDKIATALAEVEEKGYGMVPPMLEEITLEEPEIIKQGGRFGVRLKASAPSLHMVKVNVKTEFTPVVGTEKQSEDLANFLMDEFEENPEKLWESNIFGKSLYKIVEDSIAGKLSNMPPNAQIKLQETLEKIINEGSGGLIAILL